MKWIAALVFFQIHLINLSSQILINDTVGFNGTCKNQLHKIDTNFNLYEKKLININRYGMII